MKKLTLALFVLFQFSSFAFAYYKSEQSIIEANYEKTAQKVLDALFPDQEASAVVTVRLKIKEQDLDQFREELELKFTPGSMSTDSFGPVGPYAEIHRLKENVDVNLIFTKEIPSDKKDLAYKLILSKLHLDPKTGDRVNIFTSKGLAASPTSKRREISSVGKTPMGMKSIAIGILFILFAGALYFIFTNRERKSSQEYIKDWEENAPSRNPMSYRSDQQHSGSTENSLDSSQEELKIKRKRLIDESFSLMTEYPNLCINVFIDLVNQKQTDQLVAFFEEIGWSPARRLMVNLPPKIWSHIGLFLNERLDPPAEDFYVKSLENCHRKLTAKVVSQGVSEDFENPFSFIFTLSYGEKKYLYDNLSVENLATISLFSNEEDIKEIFGFLKSDVKLKVIMKISQLKEMTQFQVKALRNKLLSQLTANTDKRYISANGSEVAAKILKGLSPEKEEEILKFVGRVNKKMAVRFHKHILKFENIVNVPIKFQEPIFEKMEIENLVTILYSAKPELKKFILSLLPKNKSLMVLSDLESLVYPPSQEECSSQRRDLVRAIEKHLSAEGIDLLPFQKVS